MLSLDKARRPPNYSGGYINQRGYRNIYVPIDEREYHSVTRTGYMLEHRYVMEQYLGRKLTKNEAVHHINGNKLDNRIENLRPMKHGEHMSLEAKKRPVNWDCIEAMRQKNLKPIKDKCIVDTCGDEVRSRGLCNKHYHLYRKGILKFTDKGIVIEKQKKAQKPIEKKCAQCGDVFISFSNRGKYCDKCRTPYQHIKRSRFKKREAKNNAIAI